MRNASDMARDAFYEHLDQAHPDQAYSTNAVSRGEDATTASVACPLCKWQVFIEFSGQAVPA